MCKGEIQGSCRIYRVWGWGVQGCSTSRHCDELELEGICDILALLLRESCTVQMLGLHFVRDYVFFG